MIKLTSTENKKGMSQLTHPFFEADDNLEGDLALHNQRC